MLPCCQRCVGVYAGATVALLCLFGLRLRPSARFLQIHGLFLLQMVPFGCHWIPHGAVVRTVTGLLFGYGVAAFLFCWPAVRLWPVRQAGPWACLGYAAVLAANVALVLGLAVWGSAAAGLALSLVKAVGLAALLFMAAVNLGLLEQ